MRKSGGAFRTISEVADWLGVQTHVLRFWESKFSQIKPVKGAGGRRYYRPEDMLLIGGIKVMLYEDGLSIKEAKSQLKSDGVKRVSLRSAALPQGVEIVQKPVRKRAVKPAPVDTAPDRAETQAQPPAAPKAPQKSVQTTAAQPAPEELNFEGSLFAPLFDAAPKTQAQPKPASQQPAMDKSALSQLGALRRLSPSGRAAFKAALDHAARQFAQAQK